ncbi:MAG: alpha/beta hydrolase [Erysipelotrichales bacterium]|nr:alpha/beta hydrolase [Erysipelotrichales bacterium]MBQ4376038.1 alpha/beta hydrolase [Erysipelotrichales bacterium]
MKREIISVKSAYGDLTIHATVTLPDNPPAGIVHIMPDLMESRARYDHLAAVLASYDYIAFTADYRGMGQSVDENHPLGHMDDEKGWINNLKDLNTFCQWFREKYRRLPYYLFAQGSGALIALSYVKRYEYEINGMILSGLPSYRTEFAFMMPSLQKKIKKEGPRTPNTKFMENYYGGFDRKFRKEKGKNLWYSEDPEIVEAFNNDPLCHPVLSNAAVQDLLFAFKDVYVNHDWHGLKKDMPILFMTGKNDVMADYPKGLKKAQDRIKKAGYKNLEQIVYQGKRSQPLFGKDNEEVYRDILLWYNKVTDQWN